MMARPTYQEEMPLDGVLGEFRQALRDEVEASERHESSMAVPLANGRRIDQVGGSYQYIFEIENALNLPGDAPGNLRLPDRPQISVTVVSIEGLSIILSVPMDLGSFVPVARLQSDLTQLLRRLIERIEMLAGNPNPTGDRVLGNSPISGEPIPLEISGTDLNLEQSEAVESSLGRNATFIVGPPGTGKSRTIGAIGKRLYHGRRSVLLVSHTNIAVDEAVLYLVAGLDQTELEEGRVLRVGEPRDPRIRNNRELLLETHVARRSSELVERRAGLGVDRANTTEEIKRVSHIIVLCEWVTEAEHDLAAMTSDLQELQQLESGLLELRNTRAQLLESSSYWSAASLEAETARRQIAEMTEFNNRLTELRSELSIRREALHVATGISKKAEAVLVETTSVGWLTRRWRRLPSPEEQTSKVDRDKAVVSVNQGNVDKSEAEETQTRDQIDYAASQLAIFRQKYHSEPDDIFRSAEDHAARQSEVQSESTQLAKKCTTRRNALERLLRDRLAALQEWGLSTEEAGPAKDMLDAIRGAHTRAMAEVKGVNLDTLVSEHVQLTRQIRKIDVEIDSINEALIRVEDSVISDATVIATTLTLAYLREAIQSRRFDTVILDEASMASIPALWVAASLADANAVIVGDPQQLSPIVLSSEPLALHWLGRDIFEEAGIEGSQTSSPSHLIKLRRQYRMHPDISAIANALFYGGNLLDDETTENDGELYDWYHKKPALDHPVLLVDTGSADAWVTSVTRGRSPSRLNFLSATICVDLADQLLNSDRPKLSSGDRPRVLIVCPYRPHAQLLELLLREQDLVPDVRAGTTHNFQGAEADVVILDLVNDTPHWRVNMFNPSLDKENMRLLNVALTRARRRLIIVGDFDYIANTARKAFLGSKLIPFLREHYQLINAVDAVPQGFLGRAAEAQSSVAGGNVEPDASRLVVTQEQFPPLLQGDLARASERVVIYSPYIPPTSPSTGSASFKDPSERQLSMVHRFMSSLERTAIGGKENYLPTGCLRNL